MTTYTIYLDGGCSNNQSREKAVAYYSIAIIDDQGMARSFSLDGVKSSVHDHMPLPEGMKQTNNVAELYAWIQALAFVIDWAKRAVIKGAKMPKVVIKGDSEYVYNFLTGVNKKTKANQDLVFALMQAWATAKHVEGIEILRVPREEIVKTLGH